MKGKHATPVFNKKSMAQSVVLVMGLVGQAQAQAATVYGGGATLPAGGYVGQAASISSSRLTNPASAAGSLFGAVSTATGHTISYCQTGSGTGKRVLGGFASYSAANTCGAFTTTPLGFSGVSAAPDFAASDAPLSQSEYSSVISSFGGTRTAPVQFPAVAGAVAIVFNNPDVVGPSSSGTFPTPDLSDDTICKVFTGQITNWNQITTTIGGATFYPSRAINVVYRSDGSGTTFSFANHLTGVSACVSGSLNLITDQNFSTVVSEYVTLPAAGFTGASGNPGVAAAVQAAAGRIGYAEYNNTTAVTPDAQVATVNGKSPASFGGTLTLTSTSGQVISSSVTATGRPVLSAVTGGAQTQCLLMVPPDSYVNPTSYPIVAVSNLLGYYSGNGTNTAAIRSVLTAPYTAAIKSAADDIKNPGTGFAWLSPSLSTTINSCIN